MTIIKPQTAAQLKQIDVQKWQRLVDVLADLFDAASGDIIQYQGDHFNVLTTSKNEDNFLTENTSWSWEIKTFCKHIVENKQQIYIGNAPQDDYWQDAPFVADGQVCSYYGHPIYWPNGEIFGSFCVIDCKPTEYSAKLQKTLAELKLLIESDLQHLWDKQQLTIALEQKAQSEQQMVEEIAKRKATESQLYSQEAIVSATLEVLVDAVIRINKKGKILALNNQTEKMFGYLRAELLGKKVNRLMGKTYQFGEDLSTNIKQIAGKEADIEAIRKNGEVFPIHLSVSELKIEGKTQFICLIKDITEKAEYEKRLREFALFDHLTKCANRNLLEQRFEYHIAAAQRNNSQFSIAYIDLNKFKPINDTYGHKCGDFVLREIAERLRTHVRETDLVARVGGDEFVILFAQAVNPKKMEKALQHQLQKTISYNEHRLTVGASIGYASYPTNGKTMDLLLEYADKQMYARK